MQVGPYTKSNKHQTPANGTRLCQNLSASAQVVERARDPGASRVSRLGWSCPDNLVFSTFHLLIYYPRHWLVSASNQSRTRRSQLDAGGRRPPIFFYKGTRPPLPPLFWTEIRAKVSPLL